MSLYNPSAFITCLDNKVSDLVITYAKVGSARAMHGLDSFLLIFFFLFLVRARQLITKYIISFIYIKIYPKAKISSSSLPAT